MALSKQMEITMNNFKKAEVDSVKKLITKCNNGTKTFRYFDKRPFEIINNHVVCELLFIDDEPVGYYHIEEENDVFWFGIIVSDLHIGKGISKIIMKRAIDKSNLLKIDLSLSVDKNNQVAFNLYKNNNFYVVKETDLYYIMKRNKET